MFWLAKSLSITLIELRLDIHASAFGWVERDSSGSNIHEQGKEVDHLPLHSVHSLSNLLMHWHLILVSHPLSYISILHMIICLMLNLHS